MEVNTESQRTEKTFPNAKEILSSARRKADVLAPYTNLNQEAETIATSKRASLQSHDIAETARGYGLTLSEYSAILADKNPKFSAELPSDLKTTMVANEKFQNRINDLRVDTNLQFSIITDIVQEYNKTHQADDPQKKMTSTKLLMGLGTEIVRGANLGKNQESATPQTPNEFIAAINMEKEKAARLFMEDKAQRDREKATLAEERQKSLDIQARKISELRNKEESFAQGKNNTPEEQSLAQKVQEQIAINQREAVGKLYDMNNRGQKFSELPSEEQEKLMKMTPEDLLIYVSKQRITESDQQTLDEMERRRQELEAKKADIEMQNRVLEEAEANRVNRIKEISEETARRISELEAEYALKLADIQKRKEEADAAAKALAEQRKRQLDEKEAAMEAAAEEREARLDQDEAVRREELRQKQEKDSAALDALLAEKQAVIDSIGRLYAQLAETKTIANPNERAAAMANLQKEIDELAKKK